MPADDGAGDTEGGARGAAGTFAEGAGTVAGGPDAVGGAAGWFADGSDGAAAEGDGMGAGDGVGAAADSLGRRRICSLMKELTDDITPSAPRRAVATLSGCPVTGWPKPTMPRKA